MNRARVFDIQKQSPKKKRNTASPKSMRPDITDAAYQISPALLLTRLCNGKLQRASSERAKAGIGDSQNSPKKEIWGLLRRTSPSPSPRARAAQVR